MKKFLVLLLVLSSVIFVFKFRSNDAGSDATGENLLSMPSSNDAVSSVSSTSAGSNQEIPSANNSTPTQNILPSSAVSEVQLIRGTITWEDGLIPTEYIVKAGVPVRFEIDPKDDIEGCMSTILIEELHEDYQFVKAGKKIVMEFTPKRAGEYYIVCAMWVEWGRIKVVN